MTGQELMQNVGKRVYINDAGQKAFNNVAGEFYLVGYSAEMFRSCDPRQLTFCGRISRTLANNRSISINAGYIELAREV